MTAVGAPLSQAALFQQAAEEAAEQASCVGAPAGGAEALDEQLAALAALVARPAPRPAAEFDEARRGALTLRCGLQLRPSALGLLQ